MKVVLAFLLVSGAQSGSAPAHSASDKPKTVFAHYMMCFHAFGINSSTNESCINGPRCGYEGAGPVAGYVKEISHAARYGLDGFALEWLGGDAYYREAYDRIFSACEEWNANRPAWATKPFSLIPIMDGNNWTSVAERVALHINSSCQYFVKGKPFITSWGGGMNWHNQTQVKEHVNDYRTQFVLAIKATGFAPDGPLYIPFMFPENYNGPPDLADQRQLLADFPEVDGLWYWGCADTGDVVVNASLATAQACSEAKKYYAGPLSAPYSPHRSAPLINGTRKWSNVRYFNGQGAKGILDTWAAHITSQPDFIIYTTWNDLAEHHYLGPYNHTFWGLHAPPGEKGTGDHLVWHTSFPHLAYLQLSSYFIKWYRAPAGSEPPPITADEEAVFYFYNLQPVHNTCPGDYFGRPVCGDYYPCNATVRGQDHCGQCSTCRCNDGMAETADYPIEDTVYVTTLLASPGTLMIESGLPFSKPDMVDGKGFNIPAAPVPSKTTFSMAPGVQSVKVPLLQGGQRFTFTRGASKVVATGAEGVNTTHLARNSCNHQTHSGVINLRGAITQSGPFNV